MPIRVVRAASAAAKTESVVFDELNQIKTQFPSQFRFGKSLSYNLLTGRSIRPGHQVECSESHILILPSHN